MSRTYKYLKHKEINFQLWDECIENSPQGVIYALSWYLDIISPLWDGIVEETNGKYSAVFPVTSRKKYSVKILEKPIMSYGLGLFSINKFTPSSEDEIIEIISSKFLLINNYLLNESHKQVEKINLTCNTLENYLLPIDQGYDLTYEKYSSNRKRDLKIAKNNSLQVRRSEDIEGFIEDFNHNTGRKIVGYLGEAFESSLIRKIYYATKNRNSNLLLDTINSEGQVICSALFLLHKKRITYLLGHSNEEGRKKRAMVFLIDNIIRTNNRYVILDFAGSYLKNIATFFERFGATRVGLVSISQNRFPNFIKKLLSIKRTLLTKTKN